jgi:hypothetical protein
MMIVYGIKGNVTEHEKATRGVPFVSRDGQSITEGMEEDPFIPVDFWKDYSKERLNVQSFPNPVSINSTPIVCMWDKGVDYIFNKGIEKLSGGFYTTTKKDPVLSVFTSRSYDKFKEGVIEYLGNASEGSLSRSEEISVGISLFGKSPQLVAYWKLAKSF